jgi:hypothetical protein
MRPGYHLFASKFSAGMGTPTSSRKVKSPKAMHSYWDSAEYKAAKEQEKEDEGLLGVVRRRVGRQMPRGRDVVGGSRSPPGVGQRMVSASSIFEDIDEDDIDDNIGDKDSSSKSSKARSDSSDLNYSSDESREVMMEFTGDRHKTAIRIPGRGRKKPRDSPKYATKQSDSAESSSESPRSSRRRQRAAEISELEANLPDSPLHHFARHAESLLRATMLAHDKLKSDHHGALSGLDEEHLKAHLANQLEVHLKPVR